MTNTLQAGFARVDITPPPNIPHGVWRAQRHVRAMGIDLPITANALVFSAGAQQVVLLDLDLCLLSYRQDSAIRAAVEQATGIPAARVWPFVTHSHAVPVTFDTYTGEGEDQVKAFIASLAPACAQAATTALSSMQPVRVAAGHGECRIGINRDLRIADGRVIVAPNPDGFMDPEVGVLRIDDLDGNPLACLVNYACHPTVLGPGNTLVSPDYPGAVRRTVESITGAPCFFLQGAGGNVGPVKTFVPDVAAAHRLGDILGCEAAKLFLSLETRPVRQVLDYVLESGAALGMMKEEAVEEAAAEFRVATQRVELPYIRPLPPLYADAADELAHWEAKHAELVRQKAPEGETAFAFQCMQRARLRRERAVFYAQNDSLAIELVALRLGDIALVASWGEPYAEIGIAIKQRSPFKHTLFAGYLGGDPMYIATADAYTDPPPMEVANSPFGPGAADILIEAVIGMTRAIYS